MIAALLVLGAVGAAAEPFELDATWMASQGWSASGPSSAVEAGVGTSLPAVPWVWLGLAAGGELASSPTGAFRSGQASLGPWAGLWVKQPGWAVHPWAGWKLGTAGSGPQGGLDFSLEAWGPYSLVVGAGFGQDSWVLRVGTRSLWTVPVAPVGKIVVEGKPNPDPFVPQKGTPSTDLVLGYRVVSGPAPVRWSWTVSNAEGQTFVTRTGEGALPRQIRWDGLAADGTAVFSLVSYTLTLRVQGENGSAGAATATFRTGIVVEDQANTRLIRLASLPSDAQASEIVGLLRERGARGLTVVAHTGSRRGSDALEAFEEDRTVSQPLTLQRALELRSILARAGWPEADLRAEGAGLRRPLVPLDDPVFAWKNRRFEITWTPAR